MPYGQKWCNKCRKTKPLIDFMSRRGSTEYFYCRECVSHYQKVHRDARRSTSIPLTCAICDVKFSNEIRPDWDHDHVKDLERDWLCHACNLVIGYFDGDPLLFLQAIEYLRFHSEPNMTVFVDHKILTAYNVAEKTQCECGGFKNVVHCPQCGSTQCYANKRASPQAILPGSQAPTQVRAFRCKLCSLLFSEVDSVSACKAQTRWRVKAEQELRVTRAVNKIPEARTSALLEEYFVLHPERRPKPKEPIVVDAPEPTQGAPTSVVDLFKPPVLDEDI